MKQAVKTWMVMVSVIAVVVLNGCQSVQPKTKTIDGDAKMNLPEYHGLKHAIGCKDFENQSGWSGQFKLGNNLSIMLESGLYDTGRFIIVEREKLGYILSEQDLAASTRAAKASQVARTGFVRPARYLATGAVTEVEERSTGGMGGFSFKGISIGGKASDATITILAKLIDTTTAEVVAKKRIVGKAGSRALDLGVYRGGVDVDLGGFVKTPLGQAAQDCINKAAEFFAKEMEEMPFEGAVVKTARTGKVIINRGSEFGVTTGRVMIMRKEGEILTDPSTGAILGKEEGRVIGKLRVVSVREKLSYCDVIEGVRRPAPGTVVCDK